MQIVSPYRPFAPYISNHLELDFDWCAALRMLAASVAHVAPCPFFVLTDEEATVPVPARRYPTTEPGLMVWLLEVWHAFLTSDAFDQDTVMISPDMLVCQPLQPVFQRPFDLGLVVRTDPKFFGKRPLLNGLHFWRHSAKAALVDFFAAALGTVRGYPPELLRWGGDTEAVWAHVLPVAASDRVLLRRGVRVGILPAHTVMRSVGAPEMEVAAQRRRLSRPRVPVLDFRYRRKASMGQVFRAIQWEAVA